jgi:hypothetical protein
MRELIGYLVASNGAERAVARRAGGGHQQFQCKQFLCKQFPRKEDLIGGESIGTDTTTGQAPTFAHPMIAHPMIAHFMADNILTDRVRSDSPITVFYAGQSLTGDATDGVAGAMPGFGLFD